MKKVGFGETNSELVGKAYKYFPFLILIVSILCFCVAGYCYWSILNLRGIFEYYQIEEANYLSDENIAQTFLDFKFGVIKFSILGIISLTAGIILFKRKIK
jgi:hypothetical protein